MPPATRWRLRGRRTIDLSSPRLMGVLNLTPDSFFSESRVIDGKAALDMASRMAQTEGAAILDLGAESTRPGAARVDADTQIARLNALFRAADDNVGLGFPLSVDTTLARVARHSIAQGVDAINDVSGGLEDPEMFRVAAEEGVGLILMHRALPPDRDSFSDRYTAAPMTGDVVGEVREFLLARASAAVDAGVAGERICLDPGFGFGKTVGQNLELVRHIDQIIALGFPVLAGVSRKSFVGRVSEPGRETTPGERLAGSIALALALVDRGVRLLRVHDVAEHARAIRAWSAANGASRV